MVRVLAPSVPRLGSRLAEPPWILKVLLPEPALRESWVMPVAIRPEELMVTTSSPAPPSFLERSRIRDGIDEKVSDSKPTPPLVPVMRFWPTARESKVIASALFGVTRVSEARLD